MTRQEKIAYWIDIATYDLDTAVAMFQTKRWLYVGFMCHQVVEKILKAYYSSQTDEPVPHIHNLMRLAQLSGLDRELTEEHLHFLSLVQPLNIEARYPEYKQLLLTQLTPELCQKIIEDTKNFMQWIKQLL